MKILGFNISRGSKQPDENTSENNGYYNFSSPFAKVGKGNLAMPYISGTYTGGGGYVRYGEDNLFPNLLRQLKHTSPLHGSIMKFINNATIGGGYNFVNGPESGPEKVNLFQFINTIGLDDKFLFKILQDALMFEVINLLIENDSNGKGVKVTRIPMDELRWDENECKFFYNKDFIRNTNGVKYDKYCYNESNHKGILSFRFDDGDLIYPVPQYASANNWIFLDGESSYLHKSNILNSIFTSTVFKFPRKPASDEEALQYKKTIQSSKGASEAGRAIAFFENGLDQLPIIETLPTSNNDKLFLQTDERMDTKICQAWMIDPILMGIRVSGKLGSGSDIKQAYTIFEKNVIMPLRRDLQGVMNELMDIFRIKGNFEVANYQIINNEITDKTEE